MTSPSPSPTATPDLAADLAPRVPSPSGEHVTLRHGDQEATVVAVGGALRSYTAGGVEVVQPFDAHEINPVSHGAVLAPWPNRLGDGRYTFDGVTYQLPVTEPERGTALHGLVQWERFTVGGRTTTPEHDEVELVHDLVPRHGYPFALQLVVTYRLDVAGLTVTTHATNVGRVRAPFGLGFHPWLSTRGAAVDACVLHLDAATRVVPDDRLLPAGTEPVSGATDLRTPAPLAGRSFDDAWTDVARDEQGRTHATWRTPDGRTTHVWADAAFGVWQVCTGDAIPRPWRRTAVAVEPMTCAADALRTGEDLVVIAPGESFACSWGLTLT